MTGGAQPEGVESEAVEHIAGRLTLPQRRVLRDTVGDPENSDRPVLAGGNEHAVRALKQGPRPLVAQEGAVRYLTPLGVAVGRHLVDNAE